MANILTQAEIDELLTALSSGTEPEPSEDADRETSNVKAYDFRTADKFPKDQIRTLNIVFQTFSQLFTNLITSILRTNCECEVLSVEELTFNEFNNSLPTPVVLAIYKAEPMPGSQMIEVSPEAAYMIISRLLGGAGSGGESSKQFTEIELALLERVLRQGMRSLDDAWDKVLKIHSVLDRIETSSQFAQIVALNDPIAVITINLTIGSESGLISICIPHSSVEPVSKMLSTKLWFSGAQEVVRTQEHTDLLRERLRQSPISLTAYFEETPATLSDVMNLQVGDVIRLNQKISAPIMIKVQHIPKFYAQIGTSDSKYAVQIVDKIREDNEDEPFTG